MRVIEAMDVVFSPDNINDVRLELKQCGRPRDPDRDRARLVHPASAAVDRRRYDPPLVPHETKNRVSGLIPPSQESKHSRTVTPAGVKHSRRLVRFGSPIIDVKR